MKLKIKGQILTFILVKNVIYVDLSMLTFDSDY